MGGLLVASMYNIFASGPVGMSKWQQEGYDKALSTLEFKTVHPACPQVVATQVKEKFGDMRFYYDGGDQYTSGVIDLMENMTATTCDQCGGVGAKGGSGWISVKCAPCRLGFKQDLPDYDLAADYKEEGDKA